MTGIMACVVHEDGRAVMDVIDPSLESLQGLVGGYVEVVARGGDWVALADEEGRLKRRPTNRTASLLVTGLGGPGMTLCGAVVLVGDGDERWQDFTDLSPDVAERIGQIWQDAGGKVVMEP